MTISKLRLDPTAQRCGTCWLLAFVDPAPLFLIGVVIVLVALLATWRPAPRAKS